MSDLSVGDLIISTKHSGYHIIVEFEANRDGEWDIVRYQRVIDKNGFRVKDKKIRSASMLECTIVTPYMVDITYDQKLRSAELFKKNIKEFAL